MRTVRACLMSDGHRPRLAWLRNYDLWQSRIVNAIQTNLIQPSRAEFVSPIKWKLVRRFLSISLGAMLSCRGRAAPGYRGTDGG